jgi:peptidoglycan/xylan/chitin deacetylase (PgdA/CDA1 family)
LNFWYLIGKTFLPQLTWRRKVDEKIVYLTFDDGPHPTITPWVMDELDNVGAKGTFFVVGDNAVKYPAIVSEIKARNQKLANHTQHHTKGWKVSKDAYLQEVQWGNESIGGGNLFRPPYGQINFKAIKSLKRNYEIIMWDILTKDYLPRLNTKSAQKRIQKATRPGSIVVFHDSEKAVNNLKILLPEYLQFLKQEGYQMKTL